VQSIDEEPTGEQGSGQGGAVEKSIDTPTGYVTVISVRAYGQMR
jgi:hypothetical protein